ncbi:Atu4866 domain-containing protein [Actinoplanes sp. NPDC024001]|uniref:Atu4866 domain-containing protein n=1 Tax=Actinoplanes sp. NPDC024001 TaxID=3154598 RepID=UPI0034071D2F
MTPLDDAWPDTTVREATVLDATALLAIAMGGAADPGARPLSKRPKVVTGAAVTGAWRSPDGVVRLQLRTDGTYAGEVAGRRRPARGTYQIDGASVLLHDDDSGLNTPVTVHEGELEMAGHRLLPVG